VDWTAEIMTGHRTETSRWLSYLPWAGLITFLGTVAVCGAINHSQGHLDVFYEDKRWPDISVLGIRWPARIIFSLGFTVLSGIMLALFLGRGRQLSQTSIVQRSTVRRWLNRFSSITSFLAISGLLVMAWIPANVSRYHFYAAIAAFLLLAIYELSHAILCLSFARQGQLSSWLLAWLLLSPFGVATAAVLWVALRMTLMQYLTVVLLFSYFIPLVPSLRYSPIIENETNREP
jgi:hypothetical protein